MNGIFQTIKPMDSDCGLSAAIANGMKKIKEYPDEKNGISYAYAIKREEWEKIRR